MFSDEVMVLYTQCRMLAENFELIVYPTRMLRGGDELPGFQKAERAPAQLIGWRASFFPVRVSLGNDLSGPKPITLDSLRQYQYEWGTVVDRADAERALVEVLKEAKQALLRARKTFTGQGAVA